MLLPQLIETVERLTGEFERIADDRKKTLHVLAGFVGDKLKAGQKVNLNFICTHNSRRSHIAQLWAQTAAYYYNIPDVTCFSGGTEATAFNTRAVKAMEEAGFDIVRRYDSQNPVYDVHFSDDAGPIVSFSKKYDDPVNRTIDFAAIMTCSHADEHCPFIPGASVRIPITYDDPKEFDATTLEAEKYTERVHEIGREMFYAFSEVVHYVRSK